MEPLVGTVSYGLLALLCLSSGVLAFVFPSRLGGWLQKLFPKRIQPMSPATHGRVIAGFWVGIGVFAGLGCLYHAAKLLGS